MQIISYNFSVFCIEWKFRDYTKNKRIFQTEEYYVSFFFQPEKTNDAHYTVLMNDLHQTAQDLQDAYRNLENVIDRT